MEVEHAKQILQSLGTMNLNPKFFLFAEIVVYKGTIKFASQEFLELMRAKTITEVLGRAHADFIPRGVLPIISYMMHRECLASRESSMAFEMIFSRLDGSVFKCITCWILAMDDGNTNFQMSIRFNLDTIEDLSDVALLDHSLPRIKPRISLELDYPESPTNCFIK
jgi:hypothetical protein